MRSLAEGYAIRAANSGDIARLIAADIAASELFRPTGLIYEMPDIPDGVPADTLRQAIKEDMLLTCEVDGVAIGFALLSVRGDGDFYLDQLSVDPAHGRKGVGTALVQTCFMWTERHGFEELFLSTFRDLPWNGPFYRSLGFRELPRRRLKDWMLEIEDAQRALMDVSKRCFMVRKVRRWQR